MLIIMTNTVSNKNSIKLIIIYSKIIDTYTKGHIITVMFSNT